MKLTKFQIATVKRVNKSVSMLETKRAKIAKKIEELQTELDGLIKEISVWEEPVKGLTNGLTSTEFLNQLIEKVDEDIKELTEETTEE